MDKLEEALKKGELEDFLQGIKGYGMVYSHFNDMLNTDIYLVLETIDIYVHKNEISLLLNLALENMVYNNQGLLYTLSYLKEYLMQEIENKKAWHFKLNIDVLINSINSFLKNETSFITEKNTSIGFTYYELYHKLIDGYTGFLDEKKYMGINNYLNILQKTTIINFNSSQTCQME